MLMPSDTAGDTEKRLSLSPPAPVELSALHVTRVGHLVGHALATIERDSILQTLRCHHANRTRAPVSLAFLSDRYATESASTENRARVCSSPDHPVRTVPLNLSPGSVIDP
jgi:hypothetical protein